MKPKPKKKRNPKGTNPVGRPRKVLTEEIKKSVILGLSLGCTVQEVSANTGVSVSVLYANFKNVIKTGMDSFKGNLKKAQAKAALGGNPALLIWMGKQYLGQKDRHEGSNLPQADWENIGKTFAEAASKIATKKPDDYVKP